MTDYTPIEEIPKIHAELRKTFRSGVTKPIEWRRQQLYQLARFAKENADELAECLRLDLGRPKQEALMADICPVIDRSLHCASKLEEWMKPQDIPSEPWQQSWKPRYEKHPKGVILIISPWNYPIILSLQPLYGAISAGCCAILKPSELSPHTSSFFAKNLPKYLDPSAFKVVLGAVPEITKVLELKWDHIFYTGNGRVARIISAAVAKHLTPLTLELGGKSPVLVDSTADIEITARRILWGKINNSGQICVAPDYVLVEKSVEQPLVEALKKANTSFFPQGALSSGSFSHIVSDAHFQRLTGLLKNTKGQVVFGGKWDEGEGKRIEPTVAVDVKDGDVLLEGELFGPILPIVSVENLDEALSYVNDRDHPLVLYAFSTSDANKKKIVNNTMSGSVVFNDVFQQVSLNESPFGGVGESGYGRQVSKYSFDNFTYERPIMDVPFEDEKYYGGRYPPYTAEGLAFFSMPLQAEIPKA